MNNYYSVQLLLNDIIHRTQTSAAANFFRNDNNATHFLQLLTHAYVPVHLEPVLPTLAVFDPHHPGLLFTPDLATFTWQHDYGRTIPSAMMIAAHNEIATQRVYPPNVIPLTSFYRTIV